MPSFPARTSQIPTVRVICVAGLIATVHVWVKPDPELTREFGTVAKTDHTHVIDNRERENGNEAMLTFKCTKHIASKFRTFN